MKTVSLIILAASTIMACNNDEHEKHANSSSSEKKVQNNEVNNCYAYTMNRDTVLMQLQINGNNVTGDLLYSLYEKDKNKGTLTGQMKGDTLIAAYTFLSEGAESIREVAFIKKGNEFIEGYGDMEDRNGKMVFKNHAGLHFDGIIILKPVKCN